MTQEDPGYLLRQLFMALRVHASEALSPLGFTLPQFSVLMSLTRRPDQSSADLARMAFVTPQAMGELLNGLENANLVRRKPHKENARILLARLTSAGETALADCKKEQWFSAPLAPRFPSGHFVKTSFCLT